MRTEALFIFYGYGKKIFQSLPTDIQWVLLQSLYSEDVLFVNFYSTPYEDIAVQSMLTFLLDLRQ